ncbi:MAG: tetratricopeptide repeat protein [Byssovorax sp.]
MTRWCRAMGAVTVAIVFMAEPAFAEADGRVDFKDGQKLFDAGRQADALPLFRKAFAASNSPNARLMIARCLIALGKTAEAYEEMATTTREATARADTDPKYARTRDAAAAEMALLERRIGKLVVALAEPGAGAAVTLNGAPLGAERLGVAVAVQPGTMTIEATHPGDKPVRREITIGAGETKTVAIAFTSAAAAVVPAVTTMPDTPPVEAKPQGGGVRIAGFIVAGLGAAGMGAFIGVGLAAKSKFAAVETECRNVRCTDPKYGSVIDSGKTLQTIANASLGAGIAGIVGGALMIALGGPSRAPLPAQLEVGPTGARLRFEGTF